MQHILFLFFLLLLISCSGEDKPGRQSNEIIFNVDSTLIEDPIVLTEVGLKISPPKNWISIDSTAISNILQKINFQPNINISDSKLIILKIFVDTINKALFLIANIHTKLGSDSIVNLFEKQLEKTKDSFTFQKAKFAKDGVELNQYLIQNQTLVNFRFLGISPTSKIFQIDYFIPKSKYSAELAKAIESSLGSMSFHLSNN